MGMGGPLTQSGGTSRFRKLTGYLLFDVGREAEATAAAADN